MNNKKEYIKKALIAMNNQSELYRSSRFWEDACFRISRNILDSGFENFRRDEDNLNFFVPTYGPPGNSFSESAIEDLLISSSKKESKKTFLTLKNFLTGELSAYSDYRVFKAAQKDSDILNLSLFSESSFGSPKESFKFEENFFSRSSLNYLLGLSFFKKIVPNFLPKTVLEIGGGFGTLGEILYQIPNTKIKYIDIDLPPIFSVAHEYLKNSCEENEDNFFLSSLEPNDVKDIENLPLFSFLPSWEIKQLTGTIDLFVNFISFQEMEPEIVKNYLSIVSNLQAKFLLLRNLREGKQKATNKSTGVISPVSHKHYSKFLPAYELIGKNVCPFGYSTVDGFNSELLVFKRKD